MAKQKRAEDGEWRIEIVELVLRSGLTLLRKARSLSWRIDSSVAHALALPGLPVYVASSQLGSIPALLL